MPWSERAEQMKLAFHVDVTERTLQNWCRKLSAQEIIQESPERMYWQTRYIGGDKRRFPIEPDDPNLLKYLERRKQIYDENLWAAHTKSADEKQAISKAWCNTNPQLWAEFGCCYYPCKLWAFNAIREDHVSQIYDLTEEIMEKNFPEKEVKTCL